MDSGRVERMVVVSPAKTGYYSDLIMYTEFRIWFYSPITLLRGVLFQTDIVVIVVLQILKNSFRVSVLNHKVVLL